MKILVEISKEEYETIKASVNKSSSDIRIINGSIIESQNEDKEKEI